MPRTYKQHLEDILDAAQKIERFVHGATFEGFKNNDMMVGAVLHYLLIIGEAVKRIPEDVKVVYPMVEWRKIGGLRDVLAHVYFAVDLVRIWDIVQEKLPSLRQQVVRILVQEKEEEP
jgi:uncharacterized protein with HEPN domain